MLRGDGDISEEDRGEGQATHRASGRLPEADLAGAPKAMLGLSLWTKQRTVGIQAD